MPLRASLVLFCALLTIAPPAPAQMAPDAPRANDGDRLVGPLADLEVFLGTWTVNANWQWGMRTVATATYTRGLNGHFLDVVTSVSDNGAPAYTRYEATIYHDADEGYRLFSKQYDGVAFGAAMERRDNEDGTTTWIVRTERDGREFVEELHVRDRSTIAWTVRMKQPDGSWFTMLDQAQWIRRPEMTPDEPIDTTRFDAEGPEVRSFTKTRRIEAPAQRVYDAWATGEGVIGAWNPGDEQMVANVEQSIGGRYEWLFDGEVGSNGCRTLCYIPGRLICFTWNAPPGQETRGRRTWVAVQIRPLDDGACEVTLSHAGFGKGEAWDTTYAYFDRAWDVVLDTFKTNLEG